MKFLHTADWQIGKPFAGVDDAQKRALLQNERLTALSRIADKVRVHHPEFVVVAGDIFDSPSATKSTVSAACSAIGEFGIPVFAIPGNHDHGGAGSLWEQEFFLRERDNLAPNFKILLKAEPVELENAILFPCPLLRRHEGTDPTTWLRTSSVFDERFGQKTRIILAHGSVLNFGTLPDEDELDAGNTNLIDLTRLAGKDFDYVALGDWHGTKQVAEKAWYSGTPELDRFVKGEDHNPGNILVVEASPGQLPNVQYIRTAAIGWHELNFNFPNDAGLERLNTLVDERIANRANLDLLRLQLSGSIGIEASTRLARMIESWKARLLRIKLDNQTVTAPSPAELDGLTRRVEDPLVSRVATKLATMASADNDQATIARIALRELYASCNIR